MWSARRGAAGGNEIEPVEPDRCGRCRGRISRFPAAPARFRRWGGEEIEAELPVLFDPCGEDLLDGDARANGGERRSSGGRREREGRGREQVRSRASWRASLTSRGGHGVERQVKPRRQRHGRGRHGASAPCRHCAPFGIFRKDPENSGRPGIDPEKSGSFRMTSFWQKRLVFIWAFQLIQNLVKIFMEVLTIILKLPMILF